MVGRVWPRHRHRGRPLNSVVSWHQTIMHRPILMAVSFGLAFVAGQLLIYEPFVVPRLGEWSAVPVVWWLAVAAPAVVVVIAASHIVRGGLEAAVFCALSGIFGATMVWVGAAQSRPGLAKAAEGGVVQFAIELIAITVTLGAVVAVLQFMQRGRRNVGAS